MPEVGELAERRPVLTQGGRGLGFLLKAVMQFAGLAGAAGLGAASFALAQVPDLTLERIEDSSSGTAMIEFRRGEKVISRAPVSTLPPREELYHWGSAEKVDPWTRAGLIRRAEIAERLRQKGQALGGGLYVARDSLSTADYGEKLAVIELSGKADFIEADLGLRAVLSEAGFAWHTPAMEGLQRKLLDLGVTAIVEHDLSTGSESGWFVLFDTEQDYGVRAGTVEDVLKGSARFKSSRPGSRELQLLVADSRYPFERARRLGDYCPECLAILKGEATEKTALFVQAFESLDRNSPEIAASRYTRFRRAVFHLQRALRGEASAQRAPVHALIEQVGGDRAIHLSGACLRKRLLEAVSE